MKQARSNSISPMWPGTVRLALVADLDVLAPLFEEYRAFYGASAIAAGTRQFLLDRFRFNQSTVFPASDSLHTAVGFAQVYPFFTSVGLAQVLVLNDLFVAESRRGTALSHSCWNRFVRMDSPAARPNLGCRLR